MLEVYISCPVFFLIILILYNSICLLAYLSTYVFLGNGSTSSSDPSVAPLNNARMFAFDQLATNDK